MQKQRERHQKARASGEKVARRKLNPSLAQRLVQAVILPQAHYGLQMRPIAQQQLKILKTIIKKAMGIARRAHSWYMLCVVARPVHLTDPGAHAAYIHIQAVWKGLKEGPKVLHGRWKEQAEQRWRQVPQGPYCTYLAYLRRWQIEFVGSGVEVYLAGKWVDVLRTSLGECLHALRDREHFRGQMISRAAHTRQHLQGARRVDFNSTCQLARKEGFDTGLNLSKFSVMGSGHRGRSIGAGLWIPGNATGADNMKTWSISGTTVPNAIPSGNCSLCMGTSLEPPLLRWACAFLPLLRSRMA